MKRNSRHQSTRKPVGLETWPSFAADPQGATKTLLQDLIFRSNLYPELARHLAPAIRTLKNSLRKAPKSAGELILKLIGEASGMTIEELQEDLCLPVSTLRELTDKLVAEEKIQRVTTGRRIDPNKGRIEYFYVLHGQPLGSNYSTPARGSSATQAFMNSLRD